MNPPRPVAEADRILHLDVLRGLAVLGILLVNAPVFAMPLGIIEAPRLSPLPFEGTAVAVWWVTRVLFEHKFITLFAMLFGVSTFLVGGERGDPLRERVIRRRLRWLALFGVLHGAVVWFGDVLLVYAVAGLVLKRCRSWAATRLATVGVMLFLLLTAVLVALSAAAGTDPGGTIAADITQVRSGLAGAQSYSTRTWLEVVLAGLLFYFPLALGLMMIGLALFKTGVLQGRTRTSTYVIMLTCGAAALAVIAASVQAQLGGDLRKAPGMATAPNALLAPVVTLGYVAGVALLLRGRGAALLRPLAAVGRMAFTNYIAQSLIMTTVFYGGRGLGLFGTLNWDQWALIVLAVWVAQLLWSPWWLRRHRMGPLEQLWRRLSYGRDALRESAPAG